MADSTLTRSIARQYDLFQQSLETLERPRKYLNYGFTTSRRTTYEDGQERLCLEVFAEAAIEPHDVVVDVGFGSGEQDLLLARRYDFATLHGFNVAERQVRYARARARAEGLDGRLRFHLGAAESLPGLEPASVDRMLAIECAFYFERRRFYRRAAEVLRPGGSLVLADIALSGALRPLTRWREGLTRVGTRRGNRAAWEEWFRTVKVRRINRYTWPGAQRTVSEILRTVPRARLGRDQTRQWLEMAASSQLVALGLLFRLLAYDLVVLEARG
jgi:cyclopropane fatty-acyl-phospholipid synthase-like methyltransferase